jgi:hypothetical protein
MNASHPHDIFPSMNCQHAREVLPELLDHRTPATAHLEARAHLAGCPDCQRELATLAHTLETLDRTPTPPPSPRLRTNFYAMLEAEKRSLAKPPEPATPPQRRLTGGWRWILGPLTACALVTGGFFAGQRSVSPAERAAVVARDHTKRELDELRRKVDTMGQLVGYSLLQQQQQPANDRLRGVLTFALQEDPDERTINELIGALALDSSVNVRLRALDGLFPHADREVVRAAVLASLGREQNPLVQVSMIEFLALAGDEEARPTLEKISASERLDNNVREAARRALLQF